MLTSPPPLSAARDDFRQARRRADLQEIMARLTGRSTHLLSFEEVRRQLRATAIADAGLREIPLAAIVGSTGRYTDFTRDFLPRHSVDEMRWARVKTASEDPDQVALPPIEVYQIGTAYFVRDGHHRVSVARQQGLDSLPAYVTEVQTKVPLAPDDSPDELIIKAEYAAFLEATRLDELRPGAALAVSAPGAYQRLEDHIEVHRYFVETEQGRPLTDAEAVTHWYDHAYLPFVQAVRERGVLREFPDRTETDLYLWVGEHAAEVRAALGWAVPPETVLDSLAAGVSRPPALGRPRGWELVLPAPLTDGPAPGVWRRQRLEDRYLTHLFRDILVPLNGEPDSWQALDQALAVAAREDARLLGLHIVADEAARQSPAVQAMRATFERQCAAAGRPGVLAVEVGEIAPRICERAALADLVVVHLAHPPSAQPLERLSSGFRTLVRRCPRPIMAVPQAAPALERLLVAFDGSPKAKEALFVAAYLAGQWAAQLAVLTVLDTPGAAEAVDFAHRYLEFHEQPADLRTTTGAVAPAILETAAELESDLVLLGGYGAQPVVEVILGSGVDQVLRATGRPLLICR